MLAILKSVAKPTTTMLFASLMLLAVKSQAQQDALFSQYMFNMLPVNPAYAGSRDVTSLTVLRRWQWSGIEGAPRTTTFSGDMPIKNQRMGLGLIAQNDQIGVTKANSLYANYAYRIKVNRKGTLAFGLMGGFTNYQANLTAVYTTTSNDPSMYGNINTWMPNIGAGIYYSTDRFYAGVSTPHMVNNSLVPGTAQIQSQHFFAMAGYVIHSSQAIDLKPSILLKYVNGAPVQLDVNLNVWFNARVALGASLRGGSAFVGMAEWQLSDQLRIGYAYDMTTSHLQTYTTGSHELLIRYELGFSPKKMVTPRYF